MKSIKVLGTGCANCKCTVALIEAVAREKEVQITLEKVEDLPTIMGYGVMSTSGVVIDTCWCMRAECRQEARSRAGFAFPKGRVEKVCPTHGM